MSLGLDLGTKPAGTMIKTFGLNPEVIFLGNLEISLKDFLYAAHYVLTNTDLVLNDQRLQFLECVKSMEIVSGYNTGGKRLKTSVLPIKA